jgi:hypothetical protein
MTKLEGRMAALMRSRPFELPRRPLSDARFLEVAAAVELEHLASVRTSTAFARRFDAEAEGSGLALDRSSRSPADTIRKCRVCSAQVGLYDRRCFNCQSELEDAAQAQHDKEVRSEVRAQMWEAAVRSGTVPEARFARVLESRSISERPWRLALPSVSRWKTLA